MMVCKYRKANRGRKCNFAIFYCIWLPSFCIYATSIVTYSLLMARYSQFSETCSLFQQDEHRRLYLYGALFLPVRKSFYVWKKEKQVPFTNYIFRNSLKLKVSDAEMMYRTVKTTDRPGPSSSGQAEGFENGSAGEISDDLQMENHNPRGSELTVQHGMGACSLWSNSLRMICISLESPQEGKGQVVA